MSTGLSSVSTASWKPDGLVVEGVDDKARLSVNVSYEATLFGLHKVGGYAARHLLAVLYHVVRGLVVGVDVLEYGAAEGCRQHLYATANSENGYLPVVGQPRE